MHPKNSHRREAVTAGTYVEITNEGFASDYLARMLSTNLKNEFASRETAIRVQF